MSVGSVIDENDNVQNMPALCGQFHPTSAMHAVSNKLPSACNAAALLIRDITCAHIGTMRPCTQLWRHAQQHFKPHTRTPSCMRDVGEFMVDASSLLCVHFRHDRLSKAPRMFLRCLFRICVQRCLGALTKSGTKNGSTFEATIWATNTEGA